MLSKDQIKRLQILYKQLLNREITDEEAQEQGSALLRLVELVYTPMTEEEFKQINKKPPP